MFGIPAGSSKVEQRIRDPQTKKANLMNDERIRSAVAK